MRLRRSALQPVVVVLGVALLAGPATAAVRDVSVGNFYFDVTGDTDSDVITVQTGDQLRFTIADNGPGTPHTVEIDAFEIHSGPLRQGETFTTPPLDQPGSYKLYCKPHEPKGHFTTVVVEGSAPPPPPPSPTPSPTPTTTTPPPAPPPSPSPRPSSSASAAPSPTPQPSSTPSRTPNPTAAPDDTTSPQPTDQPTTLGGGTTDPDDTVPPSEGGDAPAPGDGSPSDRSGEALAPVGRGTADPDEVAGAGPPWTRVIPWSLVALVLMGAVAGAAVLAGSRRSDDEA